MKAWRAGMITVLIAVFIVGLPLPPSIRAQVEPSRTDPPAGVRLYEPWAGGEIWSETPAVASTGAPRVDGEGVVGSYSFSVDDAAGEDDDRVPVALATFGAAVAAVLVLSAGYLLRRRLGLIKPPPTQDREH